MPSIPLHNKEHSLISNGRPGVLNDGLSQLTNRKNPDWVAATPEEKVRLVHDWYEARPGMEGYAKVIRKWAKDHGVDGAMP